MESEKKSVAQIMEEVIEDMCDHYCKWPNEPIPEGKTDDWLIDYFNAEYKAKGGLQ